MNLDTKIFKRYHFTYMHAIHAYTETQEATSFNKCNLSHIYKHHIQTKHRTVFLFYSLCIVLIKIALNICTYTHNKILRKNEQTVIFVWFKFVVSLDISIKSKSKKKIIQVYNYEKKMISFLSRVWFTMLKKFVFCDRFLLLFNSQQTVNKMKIKYGTWTARRVHETEVNMIEWVKEINLVFIWNFFDSDSGSGS